LQLFSITSKSIYSMRRFSGLILSAVVTLALTTGLQAQNRNVGARTFTMDDGAGHTYTMQTPTGMTGNVTYTFPAPPTGAGPAGYVNVGTSAGQTLFWNGTTLAWEASSIITNNTNGNGAGVSITAPVTLSNLSTAGGIVHTTNTGLLSSTTLTAADIAAAGTISNNTTGHASLDLALTGGTMSGAISMNTSKITNLGTPTVSTDAATKAYVDAAAGSSFSPVFFVAIQVGLEAVAAGAAVSFSGVDQSVGGITLTGGNTFTFPASGYYSFDYMLHPTSPCTFRLSNSATESFIDCAANVSTRGGAILFFSAGATVQLDLPIGGPTTLNAAVMPAWIRIMRIQ
jgi:hypothetical protein